MSFVLGDKHSTLSVRGRCWQLQVVGLADPVFMMQARSLRDSEHIFREGPVEIGLPCSIKNETKPPCVPTPGKRGTYQCGWLSVSASHLFWSTWPCVLWIWVFYDMFPFSLRLQIQLSTLRPLLYSQLKIYSFFIQYILITVSSPSSPLFKSKTKCSKLRVVCEGVAGGGGCV